jgi:hypothetical protein
MLTRKLSAFILALSLILGAAGRAHAQAGPPGASPEQQAMVQQIQSTFQTIMQNMQAKGMDPQTFFQQLQSGADPADIQKQLVSQGIIDQATLDNLQSTVQKLAMSSIKQQLNISSDDEWNAIQPQLQKVIAIGADLNNSRTGGLGGFMSNLGAAPSDVAVATRELRAALKDPSTPAAKITILLQNLRDAKDKARTDFTAAEDALRSIITVRQEGVLQYFGIID